MSQTGTRRPDRIRVVQLTDLVNRNDFIDVIVEHADRDRFDVRVATFGGPSNITDPAFAARGVEALDLRARRGRWSYPTALRRLIRYVRNERIDVVHTHHFDPTALGWLATNLSSTKLVVGRHYSDAIHLATTGAKRWAHLAVERRTHLSAAAVAVPSEMIAELVRRIGVPSERIHVVPYAFVSPDIGDVAETGMAEWRRRLSLPPSAFIVGTFARLYRDKGHQYLLEAISQLTDEGATLLWLIVGDGAERDALESAVDRAALRRHVRFTGWRPDAAALMAGVDVVVQPTLQEAFSSVMGEAMWLRRPLVITDVSGATDVIANNESGLLVPKRDPRALAEAIRTLRGDAALREKLAEAGFEFVTTELTPERIVPRYERIYEEVGVN